MHVFNRCYPQAQELLLKDPISFDGRGIAKSLSSHQHLLLKIFPNNILYVDGLSNQNFPSSHLPKFCGYRSQSTSWRLLIVQEMKVKDREKTHHVMYYRYVVMCLLHINNMPNNIYITIKLFAIITTVLTI